MEKRLLNLVQLSVSGKNAQLQHSEYSWLRLYKMSLCHAVSALVADSLQRSFSSKLSNCIFDSETRMRWAAQVVTIERLYAHHVQAMADLAKLFASRGIRLMVMKGYGLSLDWPIPNHRTVGDLDIYCFGKWREADVLVAEECGVVVDEGHEHHTVFNFKGVAVENHYDFINTKAHRDAVLIEKKLKDLAGKNCKEVTVHGAKIYLPSADFNVLFLMRHMAQHFAGEHLILRQVLDWGFFIRAHHDEVDWNVSIDSLIESGLYTFFHQINAICVDHLGFEAEVFPPIARQARLEARIFNDILHPEFMNPKPSLGLVPVVIFKFKRWWHNRWKSQLVYKDDLLLTFFTLAWSHLKRWKSIKD